MKVTSIDGYKDGGTVIATFEDGRVLLVDHRLGSATKGALYDHYPKKGSVALPDPDGRIAEAIMAEYADHNAHRNKLQQKKQDFPTTEDWLEYRVTVPPFTFTRDIPF